MPVAEQARRVLDLKTLSLPERPQVLQITVEDYVDSTGDDALRVDVLMEDMPYDEFLRAEPWKVKEAIHDRLRQDGITEFPYIHLAMPHELAEDAEEDL